MWPQAHFLSRPVLLVLPVEELLARRGPEDVVQYSRQTWANRVARRCLALPTLFPVARGVASLASRVLHPSQTVQQHDVTL